jgi:hypothetical protein
MVRILVVCALLLGGLLDATAAQGVSLDSTAVARSKYDSLAVRVAGGDTQIDWRELRLAAVVAGVNGDFDWHDADKKSQAAFNAGKYDDALALALSITKHNIASPNGHFDAFVAYKHLDKTADMQKEQMILGGILKSIADSGDGKSAATAYFTVDPSEEYIFMELVLGLSPKGQALSHKDGHDYDVMTAVDDAGKESTLWFNTDTDMQMSKRAFVK